MAATEKWLSASDNPALYSWRTVCDEIIQSMWTHTLHSVLEQTKAAKTEKREQSDNEAEPKANNCYKVYIVLLFFPAWLGSTSQSHWSNTINTMLNLRK